MAVRVPALQRWRYEHLYKDFVVTIIPRGFVGNLPANQWCKLAGKITCAADITISIDKPIHIINVGKSSK